jgi:hypothetical protein
VAKFIVKMAVLFVVKLKEVILGVIMAVHMGKKKMAKGGMMKEEKMMKREGRGMAKADMQKMMGKKKMMAGGMAKADTQKKMAYGGKVKKMQEGGMTAGETQAQKKTFTNKDAASCKPARAVPQRSRLGGVPGDMRALAPQGGASLGGMKKGGMAKKGYHKMPDGKMMKDSAHKGMKKMAKGGSVKKGCDGVATKGKTKGE